MGSCEWKTGRGKSHRDEPAALFVCYFEWWSEGKAKRAVELQDAEARMSARNKLICSSAIRFSCRRVSAVVSAMSNLWARAQRPCLRGMLLVAVSSIGSMSTGCHARQVRVAVIPRTTETLLWEPMHQGVAEVAAREGVRLYWNAPMDEGDVQKQAGMLAAQIGIGRTGILGRLSAYFRNSATGIVFAPDETLATRSLVMESIHRKIPVVIVDDEIGPETGPYLSYVGNDESVGARMAAGVLADMLHRHGRVAVMGISTYSESGVTREEDFEKALREVAPDIEIVERKFGDAVIAHQQQIAQKLCMSGSTPNAIVSMTAIATRGAYYARLTGDIPESVRVVGFDQDLLTPIREGKIDAVVAQDTERIGELAMQNVLRQIRGESVPEVTRVPPVLLVRDTVDSTRFRSLRSFSEYSWSER